jgi:hypothetical protein
MGHDTVLKARTAPEGELLGLPFAAKMHPTWVVRVSHAFLDVNNAAVQYGDYWRGFLSMTTLEIRPRADIPELLRQTLNPRPQGPSTAEKWRHQIKNGTVFPAAITSWELTFHGRHAELVLAWRDSNDLTCGSALQDHCDSSGHSQYLAAVAGIASPRVTKEAKCGA